MLRLKQDDLQERQSRQSLLHLIRWKSELQLIKSDNELIDATGRNIIHVNVHGVKGTTTKLIDTECA